MRASWCCTESHLPIGTQEGDLDGVLCPLRVPRRDPHGSVKRPPAAMRLPSDGTILTFGSDGEARSAQPTCAERRRIQFPPCKRSTDELRYRGKCTGLGATQCALTFAGERNTPSIAISKPSLNVAQASNGDVHGGLVEVERMR